MAAARSARCKAVLQPQSVYVAVLGSLAEQACLNFRPPGGPNFVVYDMTSNYEYDVREKFSGRAELVLTHPHLRDWCHDQPCAFVEAGSCVGRAAIFALLLLGLDVLPEAASARYIRHWQKFTNEKSPCHDFDGFEDFFLYRTSRSLVKSWLASHGKHTCAAAKVPSISMDRHLSNKGSLGINLARLYDDALPPIACKARRVLEIGIGTTNIKITSNMDGHASTIKDYTPGASLRAWRDIFPLANITGIDVDPQVLVKGRRLETFACNSLDKACLRRHLNGMSFDVIVDDGDHDPINQRATLRALWQYLKIGGYYFVEDVQLATAHRMVSAAGRAVFYRAGASKHQNQVAIAKLSEKCPFRYKRPNDLHARYNACWSLLPPTHPGPQACCQQMTDHPAFDSCFDEDREAAECCSMHYFATHATA
eukprot:TRINITY_DN52563_c0_g1_i2.p1 TRINITY_DN52563_c0_g1~~TRINITY_DN52563_c0_g1_i2.p1  ORF type:complete len:424 (-),score=53.07 TRINITY_DN52563_c0_g1_i2:377-1648(-)